MHDKIILFDAALLVQKTTMLADYAERSIKYYDLTNLWDNIMKMLHIATMFGIL